jgi:hypothetical protein
MEKTQYVDLLLNIIKKLKSVILTELININKTQ